jgi:voltage-gated potassium channel Kch
MSVVRYLIVCGYIFVGFLALGALVLNNPSFFMLAFLVLIFVLVGEYADRKNRKGKNAN